MVPVTTLQPHAWAASDPTSVLCRLCERSLADPCHLDPGDRGRYRVAVDQPAGMCTNCARPVYRYEAGWTHRFVGGPVVCRLGLDPFDPEVLVVRGAEPAGR